MDISEYCECYYCNQRWRAMLDMMHFKNQMVINLMVREGHIK